MAIMFRLDDNILWRMNGEDLGLPDARKEARVCFCDSSGIEHAAVVRAKNRYHAFGLAMALMRKCTWCHPDYRGIQQMSVELLDPKKKWRKVYVNRTQFEAWLAQPDKQDAKEREYVQMLLGRIAPSRDFKRGRSAR